MSEQMSALGLKRTLLRYVDNVRFREYSGLIRIVVFVIKAANLPIKKPIFLKTGLFKFI